MKTYLSMPSRLRRFPLNRSFPKFALSFCTADGKWPPRFAGSATCRTTPACGRALRTTHPMYRSDRPHSHAHGASESPSGQACQQLVDGSKSSAFHGLRIDAAYTNGGGDDGGEAQAASRTSLASTPSLGQISVARSESPLAGSSGAAGNGRPDHRRDASLSPPLPRSLPPSSTSLLPSHPPTLPPTLSLPATPSLSAPLPPRLFFRLCTPKPQINSNLASVAFEFTLLHFHNQSFPFRAAPFPFLSGYSGTNSFIVQWRSAAALPF